MNTSPRPLSPFWIYKPQISSASSIFHRMTSVATYIGLVFIILWLSAFVASNFDPNTWKFTSWGISKVIFTLWSWAFAYYVIASARHTAFNLGLGFSLPVAKKTGYACFAFATVVMMITFTLTFF